MNEMLADSSSPQVVQNPRTGLSYYLPKSLKISSYELSDLVEVFSSAPTSHSQWEVKFRLRQLRGRQLGTGESSAAPPNCSETTAARSASQTRRSRRVLRPVSRAAREGLHTHEAV
mgnify:CR=1 FL=1